MNADTTSATARERRLLQAARGGDSDAFSRLVEAHRTELHAHCYWMLGSVHDAEDALQDALLRAWRGLTKQRPKRILPIDPRPPIPTMVRASHKSSRYGGLAPIRMSSWALEDGYAAPEARYKRRESVELAFIAALQHLQATQRAALIIREVLGFAAREAAETLDTTVASVNGARRRARKAMAERLPDQSQQATLRAIGDHGLRKLVERYVDAWELAFVPDADRERSSRCAVCDVRRASVASRCPALPPPRPRSRAGVLGGVTAGAAVLSCGVQVILDEGVDDESVCRRSDGGDWKAAGATSG